jgi:hypothetical protein
VNSKGICPDRRRDGSGSVEGLNNKVKTILKRSYGIRTERTLEVSLYHALGKLPEPTFTHKFG